MLVSRTAIMFPSKVGVTVMHRSWMIQLLVRQQQAAAAMSATTMSATTMSATTTVGPVVLATTSSSSIGVKNGTYRLQQQFSSSSSSSSSTSSSTSSSSSSDASATTSLIINAVGADRLGIVSDISKVVIECGGNVGESVAGRLGTHFSLMMLVTVPKSKLGIIKDMIKAVTDVNSAVFDTTNNSGTVPKTPSVGYAGKFSLEGADHPGIVHRVTSALAKSGLNIDQLHTEQELAPYGGAVLFKMRGVVVATAPLAKNFDITKIKADLSTLGDTLNCEVALNDLVDEKYQGSFYAG